MTHLEEYHNLIVNREVIVGEYIEKAIENLVEDLKNPAYIYDTTEANKRIAFEERFCLQSKQPYYMKPIKLLPFQKAFWECLYSFKMADTGLRRFTEALWLMARKNGKSTSFAADGMTDLFVGAGGADICCASNDDRQAKLIWSEIAGMRSRLDPKKAITGQNLTVLTNRLKNISCFRLSSKTQNKDGFNFAKVFLDESHDMENDEIAEACWRAMGSQEEPLFLNCTTEGFVTDGYLDKKIIYAKNVVDGIIDDPHFLAFLFLQDSEEEVWQDEASWEKSNPSIRYGVKKLAKLRRDIQVAKYDKAARIHMLCKDFNIKQNSSEGWLMDEDYNYTQTVHDLEEFRNCICLAAVDLAETTDLTNCKLLFIKPDSSKKYIFSHYWIPEGKLAEHDDHEAGAKYKEWAADGYMTIQPGNIVDLTKVADWLVELYRRYNIRVFKCGYDQRFSKDFLQRMDDYGIECEMINQSPDVMSSPMKWVEADFKSRLINYGGNPVDKMCFKNACIKVDERGRCMCVKPRGLASRKIDGAVTTIILYATLQRFQSEFLERAGN